MPKTLQDLQLETKILCAGLPPELAPEVRDLIRQIFEAAAREILAKDITQLIPRTFDERPETFRPADLTPREAQQHIRDTLGEMAALSFMTSDPKLRDLLGRHIATLGVAFGVSVTELTQEFRRVLAHI